MPALSASGAYLAWGCYLVIRLVWGASPWLMDQGALKDYGGWAGAQEQVRAHRGG